MRCLGIPNTAHFANITAIADAIACKEGERAIYNLRESNILRESSNLERVLTERKF